jgi:membrane-bound lytic murein transglycosylase MltF
VRLSSRPVSIAAGLAIAVGLLLLPYRRTPPPLPPPDETHELVVVIRPGPVVYFPGPDGALAGLDVDLARAFAAERKFPLRFVLADSAAAVIAAVAQGRAHVGAGGLYRPPSAPVAETTAAPDAGAGAGRDDSVPAAAWTTGYATVEPVVIYNRDGYKPRAWTDLDRETVAYADDDAGFGTEIAAARAAHPAIVWQRLAQPTASLISQVSDGTLGYAIIGSLAASVARNVYLDFEVAFAAGSKRDVA